MKLFKFFLKNKSFKHRSQRTPALFHNPQKRVSCVKPFIITPKKPNSAKRKVAKVNVLSRQRITVAYIPGKGHTLNEYCITLIQGGKTQDLPAVKYSCVRGTFDLIGVRERATSRSKFGVKQPDFMYERPEKTLKGIKKVK